MYYADRMSQDDGLSYLNNRNTYTDMTSNYYTQVILERFTSRQLRRHHRRGQTRKLADFPRHYVLPLDGPAQDISVGGHIHPETLAIFDNKAANAVLLDAETQLKSGYPTIATSSLVNRRSREIQIPEDFGIQPDMRFFSELVKPIQCRMKFESNKLKTLAPSKHGFHPRSQSPTFQRLIEATEKLQVLSEDDSGIYVERYDDEALETQSQIMPDVIVKPSVNRSVKSEPSSTRGSISTSILATKEPTKILEQVELRPEIRTIEPLKKDETVYEEDEDENDSIIENQTLKHQQQREFKVDFKRTESHSELHLFLPHILDAYSRGATPDNAHTKNQTNKIVLPSIADISEAKTQEDEKSKNRKIKDMIVKGKRENI